MQELVCVSFGKPDRLGCAVLLCFVVGLTLLLSSFLLISHLHLHVYYTVDDSYVASFPGSLPCAIFLLYDL